MADKAGKKRAGTFLKAALTSLSEKGGSLPWREVKAEVQKRVPLSPEDLYVYPKTGYVRWQSVLHLYSIDAVKAGYLRKHSGQWHLTPEGEAVLSLSADEIIDRATKAYLAWKAAQA